MNNPWIDLAKHIDGINAIRVDIANEFNLFWAITNDGRYLFYIEHSNLSDWPKKKIKLDGIEFEQRKCGSIFRLVMILKEQVNWDIFYRICNDLIESIGNCSNEKSMLQIIYNRLIRWQKIFKALGSKLLSYEAQQGLIGELIFLKEYTLVNYPPMKSLEFWRGPHGDVQDFGIGNIAIEVKSKRGTKSPYVKISSLDQLECSMKELFLFVVFLNSADSSDSFSLGSLVAEVRQLLVFEDCRNYFDDTLALIGYIDLPEYFDHKYLCSKHRSFEIVDGFPRLTSNDVLPGITDVKYRIHLNNCSNFEIDNHILKGKVSK